MKIAILGYAGSGKTYLADYIAQKRKIPVLHLDEIKWDKDWKPIDNSLVLPIVEEFMTKDDWIIDGYYEYLFMNERLEQADKIYLLLYPRSVCFFRAIKRTFSRRREGYKNDLNWWFIKFLLFGCRSKERQEKYAEIAEKYKVKTLVIRNPKHTERLINHITCNHLHTKKNKMNHVIELLDPKDYRKCSNIWDMKSQPLAGKWLEEILSGNRRVFIYKINGKFIGEGALVFDSGDPDYTIPRQRIYISRMIVRKDFRNQGIGSRILTFLIEKAKEEGFSEITIGVDKNNVNALNLYRKHGFTEVIFDGADKDGEYFKLMKRI